MKYIVIFLYPEQISKITKNIVEYFLAFIRNNEKQINDLERIY